MKMCDNWRLGVAPIKAKKWRHALVASTMGVVLGLIMAIGLGIAGLEQAVRKVAPEAGEPGTGQIMDLALNNVKVNSVLDLFLAAVPVKTPFTAYEVNIDMAFEKIWRTYAIIAGILMTVSLFITVMTLSRLLGQETKNRKLYQAKGATLNDLRRIYGCYTLMLGVLVCLLAVIVGLGLMTILSLLYAVPLTRVFELAYGAQMTVWLVGWSWRLVVILLTTIVAMTMTGIWKSGTIKI